MSAHTRTKTYTLQLYITNGEYEAYPTCNVINLPDDGTAPELLLAWLENPNAQIDDSAEGRVYISDKTNDQPIGYLREVVDWPPKWQLGKRRNVVS